MTAVESLLGPDRQHAVDRLESAVAEWRDLQGKRPLPSDALPLLPDGRAVEGQLEWRLRQGDLELVRRLLAGRAMARVLDVGAWNGWLAHRLSELGHEVTATDVFAGPLGLGAPWPAEPAWRRVQVDFAGLPRLGMTFDVVILDRCLQFAPDPVTAVRIVTGLVADDGRLIATGLVAYRSARAVSARIAAEASAFRERFGIDLFLDPTNGYLDAADLERLRAAGLTVAPDPSRRGANLRARLDPTRPSYHFGWMDR